MDEQLQEMLDHHRIRKTLSEYCHACDRCDEEAMGGVYVEDSWDDHGIHRGTGAEFANNMTAIVRNTTHSLAHLLGQSLINVEGDSASAETYFFAVSTSTREDGAQMCNQLGGRFVDKLLKENGRWLIKHRTVVKDWAISLPVEADWTAHAELITGDRTPADPGWAVLSTGGKNRA